MTAVLDLREQTVSPGLASVGRGSGVRTKQCQSRYPIEVNKRCLTVVEKSTMPAEYVKGRIRDIYEGRIRGMSKDVCGYWLHRPVWLRDERGSLMKRRKPLVAVLLLGSVVATPVALADDGGHKAAGPSAKSAAVPAVAVLVEKAQKRALGRQTEFVGRVEALEKVDLRARVTGFLRERNFEAGAKVKAGDTLYLIEKEPFEAALLQRRAQLAAAKATQENAATALKRYEQLESRQVASTAQLDDKIAEEKRSSASILEAQAAIQNAEIQISYTTIKAPISGTIGRSLVDPGNLVGPETGVLATIVRTDKMYVLFPVTQSQLLEARKNHSDRRNLSVRAKLADGSFLEQKGVIDFIDVKVDPRTDGQTVRAIFPNDSGALTDGQTVRLVIERSNPDEATTIPTTALATDQGGTYVFVVDDKDLVEQRRVKLGVSRDGAVVVTEGVQPGERVIVQGIQKVRTGMKVKAELRDGQDGAK